MCVGRYAAKVMRNERSEMEHNRSEMSEAKWSITEAKWSITEAKCLQISHNKYASQRDAISPL